jgi:hypothetical protein
LRHRRPPNGDEKLFTFMLRNCAGRAPAELDTAESVEDD